MFPLYVTVLLSKIRSQIFKIFGDILSFLKQLNGSRSVRIQTSDNVGSSSFSPSTRNYIHWIQCHSSDVELFSWLIFLPDTNIRFLPETFSLSDKHPPNTASPPDTPRHPLPPDTPSLPDSPLTTHSRQFTKIKYKINRFPCCIFCHQGAGQILGRYGDNIYNRIQMFK